MDLEGQHTVGNGTEPRELFFGIISRDRLSWSEHSARILNIGSSGLWIETREHVEPGYVWLRQRIRGTRGGFLEWSKRRGERYCARIRFVPLSWNVKHYVRERARRSHPPVPLRDPAEIIAGLLPRRGPGSDH
jgi:hypothetical protein